MSWSQVWRSLKFQKSILVKLSAVYLQLPNNNKWMSLCVLWQDFSETWPPILMKLCMWPRHIPRTVYVKFQKIPFTNKSFLLIAKIKAAGGRFSVRVLKMFYGKKPLFSHFHALFDSSLWTKSLLGSIW